MPQHLRKAVLDEGHDSVYAGHFYAKKLIQKLSLVYHWPGMRGDVIPEVCFLGNLCIYTRPGKEIQATSSQHSSPQTVSWYRNGLQGDGFDTCIWVVLAHADTAIFWVGVVWFGLFTSN